MRKYAVGLVIFALLFAAACGGSFTDKAQKTLATSLEATNAARDSFLAWDKDHQQAIVEKASTREAGEAQLAAYRQTRRAVVKAFTVAYTAIAAAAATIPLVDAGEKSEGALTALLFTATDSVAGVQKAIETVRSPP